MRNRLETVKDAYYAYIYRPEGVDHNTRGYVRRFAQAFDKVKLTDLTDERIEEYLASFPGRSPSGIQRDVVAIKAMLHYARRRGAKFMMPEFNTPAVRDLRVRFLTSDEFKRLYDAASGDLAHMRPLLMFMLTTGARPGEACALKKSDVDMVQRIAYLRTWKGGKERVRTVPLSQQCIDHIQDNWSSSLAHEPIFRNGKGRFWEKFEGENYRVGYNIYGDWKRLTARAKLVDFRPNDCRHDFATRVRRKYDLGTTAELLGHANIQTTRRYAHMGVDQLRSVVENSNV